jgi:hypothetical protein
LKKWFYFFLSLIIICICIFIFKEYYYPPLPMHSFSKTETLNKVKASNGHIVKLGNKYSYQWYISDSIYENEIKSILREKGWIFDKRKGEYFFFQSKQGNIIVSSDKWNKKYVIFYFPKGI